MSVWIELVGVFALRSAQALVLCLPTLLVGMLISGALRTFVGEARVRRWLSSGGRRDWLWAALFALALPVCSMGVIPVAATLRAMGVRWGSIVIVVLMAPVVTPYTLGYLFDRIGIEGIAWLLAGSMTGAFTTAWLVERIALPREAEPGDQQPADRSAILSLLRTSGNSMTAGVAATVLIAALGIGLLSTLIPRNQVGDWLVERSVLHAMILSVVPWFTYITPTTSAMQAGEIVQSSTMPGLLIPMIATGAAVHLGILVAAFRLAGTRAALAGVVALTLCATVIGVAADCRLHDPAFETEDSHAFEDYGRPYHLLDHPDGAVAGFVHRFKRSLSGGELLAGLGVVLISMMRRLPLTSVDRGAPDKHVISSRQMRLAVIAVLIGTSLYATYSAIPSPTMIAAEARRLSAEMTDAIRQGQQSSAERSRYLLDRRLAQLPISSALRGTRLSEEKSSALHRARQQLDLLFARGDDLPDERTIAFLEALKLALREPDGQPQR